ncbi:MAG: adenylate/guanylate cyclase domain-containing protein [Candidatus Gastranaerophilales bacterium]|nr:adenylate/guanylate cyclase domain-containing protein [Candidatus Gastranaerophilales bacterium]
MQKFKSSIIIVIIAFLFVASIAYIVTSQFVDRNTNDYAIKQITYNQKNYGSKDVVLVVIDDKSLETVRWPWARSLYTEIFDFLQNQAGAKAILFDAVITSPDSYNPNADKNFYQSIKSMPTLIAGFNLYDTDNNSGDILPTKYDAVFNQKTGIDIKDARKTKIPSTYTGIIKFPKDYIEAIPQLGSVMVPVDKDGVIRRYMPVVEYKNKLYPSLALSGFAMKTGIKDYILYDNFLCSADDCKSLRIPISQKKSKNPAYSNLSGIFMNYNWYKPQSEFYTHDSYSAIDIINSNRYIKAGKPPVLNPEIFKDKVVIVGGNANSQSLADRRNTPILIKHSGIDIQATALNDMLDNKFALERNPIATFLFTLFFAIMTFYIIKKYSIIISLALTTSMTCLYVILYNLLMANNVEISLFTPIVIEVVVIAFGYSYKFIIEGQNKEKIKNVMGKYISKDIMQNVMENIDQVKVGGIKSEVTILFADIRGFTAISEALSAEEVTGILNEYFSEIEPIIRKYDGVLNKFMGDAIMAIFGEPIKNKQHAINAVKCAHEILRKVKVLQKKWLLEEKPKISIGIGINTGEVFVGNVGSEERLEYTVIGDTVNLASRIEAHNRIYKTQFLISENTYKHINNIADVIKISNVTIRGKSRKIDIYEVLRITE